MTNFPAPPLASLTASLWSSSKKVTIIFLVVLAFSARCETILVLLSGLAAISSAYPPDLSIHPETIEASREQEKPLFSCKKTRAEPDYSEGRKRKQGQVGKIGRKNAIFLGGRAKRADFMQQNPLSGRSRANLGLLFCLIPC